MVSTFGRHGFGSSDPTIRQIDSPYSDSANLTLSSTPYGPSMTIEC